MQIIYIDPWKCLFFYGSRVTGQEDHSRTPTSPAKSLEALYLNDDLEKGPDAPPRERGETDALKSGIFMRKKDPEEEVTQDEGLA